jgi:hypothetical protein
MLSNLLARRVEVMKSDMLDMVGSYSVQLASLLHLQFTVSSWNMRQLEDEKCTRRALFLSQRRLIQ